MEIPEFTLADAEKECKRCDYGQDAVEMPGSEINWADAGAFFFEGHLHGRKFVMEAAKKDVLDLDSRLAAANDRLLHAKLIVMDQVIEVVNAKTGHKHYALQIGENETRTLWNLLAGDSGLELAKEA